MNRVLFSVALTLTFIYGFTFASCERAHPDRVAQEIEDTVSDSDDIIPVEAISFLEERITIGVGDTARLFASVQPESAAKKIVWFSSDTCIAMVDSMGGVFGISAGAATVTARAGSKTATCRITVCPVQLWARSNIVWIPDADLADGGILTFAVFSEDNTPSGRTLAVDNGEGNMKVVEIPSIPADAQGVCFRWGSLVAVSPAGRDFSADKVLFSPDGNSYRSWNVIPYMDNAEPPFDNFVESEDDFTSYGDGQGFDADEAKGDICRYISARGWVYGNWRLPTAEEIDALIAEGDVEWNGCAWDNIDTVAVEDDNMFGFYRPLSGRFFGRNVSAMDNPQNPVYGWSFPASGYRSADMHGSSYHTGFRGMTWAATSEGPDHALATGVHNGVAGLNFAEKGVGFSVRCIRSN